MSDSDLPAIGEDTVAYTPDETDERVIELFQRRFGRPPARIARGITIVYALGTSADEYLATVQKEL